MIAHTQDYKEAITSLGRDIKVQIDYYRATFNLRTENNKDIWTEDGNGILVDTTSDEPLGQLTENDIVRLVKNNLGELFRTYMKSFDLETSYELYVGDKVNIKIGTTVDTTQEYLDYGSYYVHTKEYDRSKKTYTYTLCDKMLFTMVPFDWSKIVKNGSTVLTSTTLQDLVNYICEYCGIGTPDGTLINGTNTVYKKTFDGYEITCRDVLDMCMQVSATSLIIIRTPGGIQDCSASYKTISSTSVDTIDDDILKDDFVEINEKFGPLNSLVFSRGDDTDNIAETDDTSIEENGETQYIVENNLIANQENRDDYITNMFNAIKGLEYAVIDLDTIGLGYIEYLDTFTIETDNNSYDCLCLQNTMTLDNGINETFKTKEPTEKKRNYSSKNISTKDASITLDKMKGEIVLKAYEVEESGQTKTKIAQVRLDADAEDEGSLVEIGADNIKLEGYTTINGNFSVDLDGNMECNNATMSNAKITDGSIVLNGTNTSTLLKLTNDAWQETLIINPDNIIMHHGNNNTYVEVMKEAGVDSQGQWHGQYINIKDSRDRHAYLSSTLLSCAGKVSCQEVNCSGQISSGQINCSGTGYFYDIYINKTGVAQGFALPSSNVWYFNAVGSSYIEIYIDGVGAYGINIWASDKRLKHNIKDTEVKALDIIKKIPHKEFIYNNDTNEEVIKIGYVADDLQEIDEQMVFEVGEEKIKQPNEKYIIPLLSKAIQEQQEQIEILKKEVEELKNGKYKD